MKNFYAVFFTCDQCKKEMTVVEIGVNTDADICFKVICVKCGIDTDKIASFANLVIYAHCVENKKPLLVYKETVQ